MESGLFMSKITQDEASHSVVLSSLPSTIEKADIFIYFQSRKHGGGDIKDVHVLGNGAALVTFEDKKCVQTILDKEHILNGAVVGVNQCSWPKDDNQKEVFAKVSAKIDPVIINLSLQDTRTLIKNLQKQINVRCVEGSDATFVICGTYMEIVKSHDVLSDLLYSCHNNQTEDVLKPVAVEISRDQLETNSEKIKELEKTELRSESKGKMTKKVSPLDESNTENCQDSRANSEIEISESEWRIFSKVYKKQLIQLMTDYAVVLEHVEPMSKVVIKTSDDCSETMLATATKNLSDLYSKAANKLTCVKFVLVDSNHEVKLRQTVVQINKKDLTVLERAPDRQSWQIFGEIEKVEEVLQELESTFKIKRLDVDTEHAQANGQVEADDDDNEITSDDDSEEILINGHDDGNVDEDVNDVLGHNLGCVQVSVYRGDITNKTSDAIVNPANQSLRHDAGVAKAIVSKGGQSIQDECTRIVANKGKLKTGEVTITHSGKLSCKMVIHAVGPIWNQSKKDEMKSLLKTACLSSLQQAQKYGFKSIAIPAISSGIYGMPKKVCAKVLFDAVEEYNKSMTSSQKYRVTEVNFVNNDDKTVRVFQKELKSRYGKKVTKRKPQKCLSSDTVLTPLDQNSQYSNKRLQQTTTDIFTPTRKPTHQTKRSGERPKPNPHKSATSSNYASRPTTHQRIVVTRDSSNGQGGARPKHSQSDHTKSSHIKKEVSTSNKRFKDDQTEKCPICLGSVRQPKTLPKCKHTFCKVCLEEALKKTPTCPYCRDPVSTGIQSHDVTAYRVDPFILSEYDDDVYDTMIRDTDPRTGNQSRDVMIDPFSWTTYDDYGVFTGQIPTRACVMRRMGSWDEIGQTPGRVDRHAQVMTQYENPSAMLEYDRNGSMQRDVHQAPTGRQPIGRMSHRVEHFSLPGYNDCGTVLIQYSLNGGIQGPEHPNPGQRYDGTSRGAYLPDNHQGREVFKLLKRAFDRGYVFTVGRSMTSRRDNQIIWADIPHKTSTNGGPSNYGYPDPKYLTEVQQILKAMLKT